VLKDGQPFLVSGTPGGDQQDQWPLHVFLNVVEFGMGLQEAIDSPSFHTLHAPSSFYPREARPNEIVVENRVPADVIAELTRRGHIVRVVGAWNLNYTTAVTYDPSRRLIEGAASSRAERHYALGW